LSRATRASVGADQNLSTRKAVGFIAELGSARN
jgi:hypothetical protein